MGEQLLIVLAIAAGVFLIKYLIYVFRAYLWSADKRAVFQYRTMTRRARKRLMRKRRGGREHYASLVISFDVMRAILIDEYGVSADFADKAMTAYERFNYSGRKDAHDIRALTRIYRRLIRIITWGRLTKHETPQTELI